MRLTVLGGSTPFTVPLVDEVAARVPGGGTLRLHGRDTAALAAVAAYARHRLGPAWQVAAGTDLGAALDGAEVVVHQVRYGDLRGRADDEALAAALGVPADETLGPAGLRAALRAAPHVRVLARRLRTYAPGALVLNLTNPLSVTTALLAQEGVDVLGLCELPVVTQATAAALLGLDPSALAWSYTGLNHRGVLHGLTGPAGEDLLPALAAALLDRTRLGVLGDEVAALQALPLKYAGLLAGHAPHGAGRAARLSDVRERALAELRDAPDRSPPSLRERPTPWYADAVGPVLGALGSGEVLETVANVPGDGGLVREHRVRLAGGRSQVRDSALPPTAAELFLARFVAHERAVLAAVGDPSAAAVREACLLDPLLPAKDVGSAVRLLTA